MWDAVPHTNRYSVQSVTADTGDFSPGHVDFSRYDVLEKCYAAAAMWNKVDTQMTAAVQERYEQQLAYDARRDTVSARVKTIAVGCGPRFTLANTTPAQWPHLFKLALWQGDDAKAWAIGLRRIETADGAALKASLVQQEERRDKNGAAQRAAARAVLLTPQVIQLNMMEHLVEEYLDAHPRRLALADSMIARIDALGKPALVARVYVHRLLLDRLHPFTETVRLKQEFAHIIALAGKMTPAQLMEPMDSTTLDIELPGGNSGSWDRIGLGAVFHVYNALQYVESAETPDSLPYLRRQADNFMRRPATVAALQIKPGFPGIPRDPTDFLFAQDTVITHKPAPRVEATYWFPADDSIYPRPGGVSVIVNLMGMGSYTNIQEAFFNREDIQIRLFLLRHWLAQYGAQGFHAVALERTYGSSLWSVFQPPTEEARDYAWYVQKFRQIPATVAIQETPLLGFKQQPDGTFRGEDRAAWNAKYSAASRAVYSCLDSRSWQLGLQDVPCSNASYVLIGADGTVLYTGTDWVYLDALLRVLFTH